MSILFVHGLGTITPLFWFKIITLGAFYYVVKNYKKDEIYYYKNLGVSARVLWTTTLSMDFIIFFVLMILTGKLR